MSLPPRHYDEVAEILAEGVEQVPTARASSREAAARHGHQLAASLGAHDRTALIDGLENRGYEPILDDAGVVRLRNCPFDRLAADHRELTCSLNLAMLSALASDLPEAGLEAEPVPPEGSCCVALAPRA